VFRLAARPGSPYATDVVTREMSLIDASQPPDIKPKLSAWVDKRILDGDVP